MYLLLWRLEILSFIDRDSKEFAALSMAGLFAALNNMMSTGIVSSSRSGYRGFLTLRGTAHHSLLEQSRYLHLPFANVRKMAAVGAACGTVSRLPAF